VTKYVMKLWNSKEQDVII